MTGQIHASAWCIRLWRDRPDGWLALWQGRRDTKFKTWKTRWQNIRKLQTGKLFGKSYLLKNGDNQNGENWLTINNPLDFHNDSQLQIPALDGLSASNIIKLYMFFV